MLQRDETWLSYQQRRWIRPDGDRWVRQDAARFLAPGGNVVDAFPSLAFKYNPNQPRVPAGNPDGGQWTNGWVGAETSAKPNADVRSSVDLFSVAPKEPDRSGVRLAGDLPEGSDPSPQTPVDPPPKVPQVKPKTSSERTAQYRAVASWMVRNAGLPAKILFSAFDHVEWLKDRQALIVAATDPPMSLPELQNEVGKKRPGYDDHHIVEKTWAEWFGFGRSDIDDPSNLVSIPRLKHWQITGWYMTENEDFGGRSPREYLADKDWNERRRVGLHALRMFGVLKP
ncbi:hypothetical protein NML43_03340 [Rhodopseudomonas palustris]|uniref:hypothetical protein n=1 Tax=Rhodopseudomonas palustris TaxID=1076 RepID=UPI0020CC4645|nr:hypothetical protein [Rhodopseudomonas palustris]MCP9626120.1 hypothetical protein [Rhodopseudomonas palustris]